MVALSTEWSRALGLEAPIVNAPMGGVAGGALAAAVSRAGGLGMIGIGSTGSAALLDEELRNLSELGRPFGIGLVDWVIADEPALLEVAIAAKPALLSVSFGDNWSWVQRAHDAGLAAATQVGDLQGAKRAAEAGVDVVIARGAEGGGHGAPMLGPCRCWRQYLIKYPCRSWRQAGFRRDATWPLFWLPAHPGRGWAPRSAPAPRRWCRVGRAAHCWQHTTRTL